MKLPQLIDEARACRACEAHLPLGPRPLLQGSASASVLIIGQAPGAAAHRSGIPWADRSGDRLRDWLGLSRDLFYDERRVALMPMGFCFPGTGASGDLAPRPECAPLWHPRLLEAFTGVRLTVYVGRHACAGYLDSNRPLTDMVRAAADMLPKRVVLPHPSPRNNIWLKKHPWFEQDVLPRVARRVKAVLRAGSRR